MQLVTAMLHRVQLAGRWVFRERDAVANAGREARCLSLGLIETVRVELPDASAGLELRTVGDPG